ncbi:MAG TPA: SIS domain-containing protein [Pseudonocardiaceae bacterium]
MSLRTNGNGHRRPVRSAGPPRSGDLESLYPFLYSGTGALDTGLDEVRCSTIDKIHQVVAPRCDVLARDGRRLAECASAMAVAFANGGRLFAIGDGESCIDAADLASLFLHPGTGRQALPAFALTGDIVVLRAQSNDVSFDVVFARQIAAFGRRGDVVVGLSTSANSTNLVRAFEEAGRRGLLTVGLAGYEGGAMAELGSIDHLFVVPTESVPRIQEAQTTIYHTLWELTLNELTTGRPDPARAERREVARGVGDHD